MRARLAPLPSLLLLGACAPRAERPAVLPPPPVVVKATLTPSRPGVPWRPPLPARPDRQRCLAGGAFPERLSETGCYANLATQEPGADLVPYGVRAPLWTDGAEKRRYMVLPPGTTVTIAADGRLGFPIGSVLVKEFRFGPAGAAERPIETRFMLRTDAGWQFRTYEWNEAGDEATLLAGRKWLELPLAAGPDAPAPRRSAVMARELGHPSSENVLPYAIPSRDECTFCHASAGGAEAIGTTLAQLDGSFSYRHGREPQLRALARAGLFAAGAPPVAEGKPLADPRDESAPLAVRARSWLHGNCAHCHRPGGWTPPTLTMDLRHERTLAETHACGESTQYLELAARIDPGHPERSALWRRIKTLGVLRMPPTGTAIVDPSARVVRDWIASMKDCGEN